MFAGGRSWALDDFRALTSYTATGPRIEQHREVEKGHALLISRLIDACRGERPFEPGIEAATLHRASRSRRSKRSRQALRKR